MVQPALSPETLILRWIRANVTEVPQGVAGTPELGSAPDAVALLAAPARLVPGLSAHAVQCLSRSGRHVEEIAAAHGLWATLGHYAGAELAASADCAAGRSEQLEEAPKVGLVTGDGSPNEMTGVSVDHDGQTTMPALDGRSRRCRSASDLRAGRRGRRCQRTLV